MKMPNECEFSEDQKYRYTHENYRLVKKISIAGVQFIENYGQIMASLHVGNFLRLEREPNNSHDHNAIRIDRDGRQKIGYVPRTENAELAEKMDNGVVFTAIITSLRRHERKIEADIYERMQIPFPEFTSFSLSIGGFFAPTICCSIFASQRKFVYKKIQPFDGTCNCVELTFSKDYWGNVRDRIQRFNFLAWEKFYPNPGVCDGTQWNITIRRRNAKVLKISGDNSYPEEWDILCRFIDECLDFKELKGNGNFYIQGLPQSKKKAAAGKKHFIREIKKKMPNVSHPKTS